MPCNELVLSLSDFPIQLANSYISVSHAENSGKESEIE